MGIVKGKGGRIEINTGGQQWSFPGVLSPIPISRNRSLLQSSLHICLSAACFLMGCVVGAGHKEWPLFLD